MTTKVLVTGANGQLAKTIEDLYKNNNDNIEFVFATKAQLDITNYKSVRTFFNNNTFKYCINCAAYTKVDQAEIEPQKAFTINANAVEYLAKTCLKNNVILIHISTDYVFDGTKTSPYLITDKTNPINVYGKSKLLAEEHIKNSLSNYFIIRTLWLYSKTFGSNFYTFVLDKLSKKQPISITTEQIGTPTNTVTVASYIYKIITKGLTTFGIKHITGDKPMSWYTFAVLIAEEHKLNKALITPINNFATKANRPKYSVLKNTQD